ncbi:MAG TPA: endonuclease/exonuclease/phosphatase family protein [Steroidobacteraceae bacterium]|nr:endonuclease/exonuclease/phosphatase family protein [Steroidobacteraceae bacterium]
MIQLRHVLLSLVLALTLGCLALAAARGGDMFSGPQALRIATWNMEWLLHPETARLARIACRDGQRASVPCDVARSQARDSADFGRMAALVRQLDADVIAFQEVENEAVARKVFRGYEICIAPGSGAQHAGFAVRSALRFRCEPPLDTLAAGGRGRPGQPLLLFPRTGAPVELLAVHLKSGCSRDPLDSPTAACRLLSAQAGALGEWIAARAAVGTPFMVLGDFNRPAGSAPDDPFWSQLHPESFLAAAHLLPFRNCVFGAPYGEFIDHILVGSSLAAQVHADGFAQLRYQPEEAIQFQLSDHCPVSVKISLSDSL